MRLFVALDIDESIRERIVRFMKSVRPFAPDARWVAPESLHLTLKFIGEKSPAEVEEIKAALGRLPANAMKINIRGYGFFPNLKSPRVLWAGVEAGPPLALLAAAVDESMAALGIPKEDHGFSPHLTLARSGNSGSRRRDREKHQNRVLQPLPEKLAALPAPEFGTMTARQFFLYQSQPSPGGSRYTKLEGFELR